MIVFLIERPYAERRPSWCQNLISPVLFNQAVQTLATSDDLSVDALIEIKPHTTLSGPIKQICREFGYNNLGYIPTLVRNEDSAAQLLKGKVIIDVPTYMWHYPRKFWAEPRQSLEHRSIKYPLHDVLCIRMPGYSAVEPV
ncbi:hypothetical protein PMAA_013130 [Talaromyces marneffei ATCC 18224]|uniref:Uncharacterized protein n=1 Tax=Talaromyces marneffei (strain ATCC 18224 / CBS 334.59 / QM 7333) TaxID=441960 RepID=B6QVP1_TALMQ|nr:hypothetical protein PMAA_013130 [Talaromyces marneffei ATCC 18224]